MSTTTTDLVQKFEQFYQNYYQDQVLNLANGFPRDQKSLEIDWQELFEFDSDIAEDYLDHPEQMREYAEEALRVHDIPNGVDLSDAHVRIANVNNDLEIRELRADNVNQLLSVEGIVRNNTDVRPKLLEASFECKRCGTITRIPQSSADLEEPHECQGCERDGPFNINYTQSDFIDSQALRVQESPEGLHGGETPQNIDVRFRDDMVGKVASGDPVEVTGILRLEDQSGQDKSTTFDMYIDAVSLRAKDEKFEDFDLTEEDKEDIRDRSELPDVYEAFRDSIAPSIYGYPKEKLAIMLQLFGGYTKHLPDDSRIRGDLHVLLIGDPGTGKSQLLQYIRNVAPRSVYASGKGSSTAGLCVTGDTRIHTEDGFIPIRDLAIEHHPSPVSQDTSAAVNTGLYTYNTETDSVEMSNASHVWRMPEKSCISVGAHNGKEITVSENTPLLTATASGTTWTDASELTSGDIIAMPSHSLSEDERSMPDIFDYYDFTEERIGVPDETVEHIRSELTSQYGSLKEAAQSIDETSAQSLWNLPRKRIEHNELSALLNAIGDDFSSLTNIDAANKNGSPVTLPETFTTDLLYFLGLTFGDGDINVNEEKNKGYIRISNGDTRVLEHAIDICESLFGKRPEIEHQEGRVPCIRLHSVTIARLFKNLGMQSPKRDLELTPALTTAPDMDHFVRGLMDADGWVSDRTDTEGGSSVGLTTISDGLAEQLQLLLETYNIQSRVRTRSREGRTSIIEGTEVTSNHDQHQLEITGSAIDTYADVFGFTIPEKTEALHTICGDRRNDLNKWAVSYEAAADGGIKPPENDGVDWVVLDDVNDAGEQEVFDLTVPDTHNFIGNGLITHNTAAAVQVDMGEGSEWTLEAGTLVLADKGIAAIDELDKMSPEDRSALHEGLEQQEITVSKAGINATLKSRCALLGAANPKYGRFDQYESLAEQIDLDPALISRFDLIFTITDQPDEEEDRDLANHIINSNFAGQLNTKRQDDNSTTVTDDDVSEHVDEVVPEIPPEEFRKYIAYAKQTCYPELTKEARDHIEDFYVDLRLEGTDEDAPVPVTARKLEALVRLAEASARVRLSDEATIEDAKRATTLAKSSLEDIGIDPETGDFDADIMETGSSKTQRDRVKGLRGIISELAGNNDKGAEEEEVYELAKSAGMDEAKIERQLTKLRHDGVIYQPENGYYRET